MSRGVLPRFEAAKSLKWLLWDVLSSDPVNHNPGVGGSSRYHVDSTRISASSKVFAHLRLSDSAQTVSAAPASMASRADSADMIS